MANESIFTPSQLSGLTTFSAHTAVPSAYLNNINSCIETIDAGKHNRTGDEIHSGSFTFMGVTQVTTAPVFPTDVVRLTDISELTGGASNSNFALYTATQTIDALKVIWTIQECSGTTVNGLYLNDQAQITGFQAPQDGFFTVILSSYFTAPGSSASPQVTLHKVAAGGGVDSILETHHGMDALLWAGDLLSGDILYFSCVDVGSQATHRILIRRGLSYGTPSTATTYRWPGTVSATPLIFTMATYQATGTFALTGIGGTGPYSFTLNTALTTVVGAGVTTLGQVSFPVPNTGIANLLIVVGVTDSGTEPVTGSAVILINAAANPVQFQWGPGALDPITLPA